MSVKRRDRLMFGLVIAAALGSANAALAQGSAQESAHRFVLVQNDLDEAMKNEAFDAAKYTFFAQQARERGNQALAAVFERVANTEKTDHFRKLAALSGHETAMDQAEQQAELAKLPNKSDEANLRDAMTTERFQANALRSDMVNRAIKYGDLQAANMFLNIGNGEIKNLLAFRAAKKLAKQSQPQGAPVQS